MSHEIEAGLAGVLILATSVWTGGFAAIAVVARVTARTLAPGDRVAFFRALGRAYGVIGSAALALPSAAERYWSPGGPGTACSSQRRWWPRPSCSPCWPGSSRRAG